MLKTTLAQIKAHNPCAVGWSKLRKNIGVRKPLSTVVTLEQILESNGLNDAIWALRCWNDDALFEDRYAMRVIRIFACSCACHVAHLNSDVRVRRAIECAALFAEGLADADELAAARAAAWAAARAAAWDAAGDAAWDAECQWQRAELLRMCRGEGIYAPLED
jgi:hypothetical protein